MSFADLNAAVCGREKMPACAIVAVGGIPVLRGERGQATLFGQPINVATLNRTFLQGLGLGAVLTFKNPKQKSLAQLGEMCIGYGHGWTLHTLTLTLVFHDAPLAVRNAFAFDRRFHLSWVEKEVGSKRVTFTATGSLKEWKKIGGRVNDESFKTSQREWFDRAFTVVSPTLPQYFLA